MATWIGRKDGPALRLRVWASDLGRAGFTLADSHTGAVIAPFAVTADSALYQLDCDRDWPLRLTATVSYASGDKARIWHEARQMPPGILPCHDDVAEPPVNGPPYREVQLGEVKVGQGKAFAFGILCEQA